METREPKKGQGVPRETPQQNSLANLQGALVGAFPDVDWAALPSRLEEDGFFEASMSAQVRLMAQVSAGQLAPSGGATSASYRFGGGFFGGMEGEVVEPLTFFFLPAIMKVSEGGSLISVPAATATASSTPMPTASNTPSPTATPTAGRRLGSILCW